MACVIFITIAFQMAQFSGSDGGLMDTVPAISRSTFKGEWALPYGGSDNGCFSAQNLSGELPYVSWSLETPLSRDVKMTGPSIAGNGDVFFTRDGTLYCVDTNGSLLWNMTLYHAPEGDTGLSFPTVANGSLIVWVGDGRLVSISLSGEIQWVRGIDRNLEDGGRYPVFCDSSILFTGVNELYCFEENGSVRWTREFENEEKDPLEPAFLDNGSFFLLSSGGYLSHYDKEGSRIWSMDAIPFGSVGHRPVVLDHEKVLLTAEHPSQMDLKCYNSSGGMVWASQFIEGSTGGVPPVSCSDGSVLIHSDKVGLVSLSSYNGSLLWTRKGIGSPSTPMLSFSDGTIAQLTERSLVLLEKDGTERGRAGILNHPTFSGSMAVDEDGNIYCCTGTLTCFGTEKDPPPSFIGGRIGEIEFKEDGKWARDIARVFESVDSSEMEIYFITDSPDIMMEIDEGLGMLIFNSTLNYFGVAEGCLEASTAGADGMFDTSDDLATRSDTFKVNVTPVNDPPTITTEELPDMRQGEFFSCRIEAGDPDPGERYFTFEATGSDWLYMRGDHLEGTPGQDDIWDDFIRIRVYDLEGDSTEKRFDLNIIDMNDPPYFEDIDDIRIREDDTEKIDLESGGWGPGYRYIDPIDVEDPEDDELTYHVVPGEHLTVRPILDYSDQFEIIPDPDWSGLTYITVYVSDGEYNISARVEVEVLPRSDDLRDVRITPLVTLEELDEGSDIFLMVDFEDPDGSDPSWYSYLWTSNLSSKDLSEERILNTTLEAGYHEIEVEVYKNSPFGYDSSIARISFNVSEGGGPGKGGYEKKDEKMIWGRVLLIHMSLLFFLFLVPLFSLGIHRSYMRARYGGKDAEEQKKRDMDEKGGGKKEPAKREYAQIGISSIGDLPAAESDKGTHGASEEKPDSDPPNGIGQGTAPAPGERVGPIADVKDPHRDPESGREAEKQAEETPTRVEIAQEEVGG